MKTLDMVLTGAALGFAGFAVWWISRRPGGAVSPQPGQQQRDAGLQIFHGLLDQQAEDITNQSWSLSFANLNQTFRV